MALRRLGKNNFYHAYFRSLVAQPDGSLRKIQRLVNLYTDDLVTAQALEAELMIKNRIARRKQRLEAHFLKLEIEAGRRPASDLPVIQPARRRRKRLKIADALDAAAKYRPVGETAAKCWRAFVRDIGCTYMDEVTAEAAFDYLNRKYKGKTYNNVKSALNAIFRVTLLDADLHESPFARVPRQTFVPDHQRPFTEQEFVRIYQAAEEPWKSAVLIAWFTGLRQKDVFTLKWRQIDGDIITTIPAKTARFGRAVQIPIHPQLAEAFKKLPRVGDRVLGAWPYRPATKKFKGYFPGLLKQLGIQDNERGIVNFNCCRDSFVTRCDAAGIPRHAVRGLVGHVSDEQTDLYSHDLASARLIQQLARVQLE